MNRKQVFGDINILVDESKLTLNQVKENPSLTLLCPDVEMTEEVDVYSAVMGKDCTMINSGNYIKFSDSGPSMVNFATYTDLCHYYYHYSTGSPPE